MNSFVLSNFNHRPVVWMLAKAKCVHKIEAENRKFLHNLLKSQGKQV